MIGHGTILTAIYQHSPRRISPVAQQLQHTPIEQVLELLTEQGSDGLLEAARILS